MAVQAVDGSKVGGNAAKDQTLDKKGLERLLERMEKVIAQLEAQNEAEAEPVLARLPERLAKAEALREQVRLALELVRGEGGLKEINLTDPDAALVKSRQGIVAGYNAQAVVSPLNPEVARGAGLFITAAEVVNDPDDHAQGVPMLREAESTTGQKAGVSLLDGGYHYDAASDSYLCSQGQKLGFGGIKHRTDRPEVRVYRASASVCAACPAFGQCTKDRHQGRALEIGPHEEELRRHRAVMSTDEAKATYSQRKELVEPTFGILKEVQGARRFLLRGLVNVRAEWLLLATAFNLKTLFRVWKRDVLGEKWGIYGAVAS